MLDRVGVDGANPYLGKMKKGADPARSYNRRVEIIITTTGMPPIISGWPAAWALDKKIWKVDEGFWTKHSQSFQKFQNLGDDNYYNNVLAELRKFPGLNP